MSSSTRRTLPVNEKNANYMIVSEIENKLLLCLSGGGGGGGGGGVCVGGGGGGSF